MDILSLLWDFLNSKFGLLISGFIFTGIIGRLFVARLEKESWRRQTRIELQLKRYDEGVSFLDELSCLINSRLFAVQRYIWAVKDFNSPNVEDLHAQYQEAVIDWNIKLTTYRSKIRLLVGEEEADDFKSYSYKSMDRNDKDIHSSFVIMHDVLMALKNNEIETKVAQERYDTLNHKCSSYLERIATSFLHKAEALKLLSTADSDYA